ncbi:V-type ATP synthase subunit E [Candidatus Gugararchaeum adminiculabundum]|nr:V-type ATP synthase subunit E [Candidatus Gugararchaeum adminiculabundum]
MGLNELTRDILDKAQEEAKRLGAAADSKVAEALFHAEDEKRKLLAQAKAEVSTMAESEKGERIAAARLNAKKLISEAQEEVVAKVIGQVQDELESMRKKKQYQDFLAKAIKSALKEIPGDAIVQVNKDDLAAVKGIRGITVGAPIDCAGGAIVSSKDGTVRVNATFESLIEEKKDEIRRQVFKELFGGKNK